MHTAFATNTSAVIHVNNPVRSLAECLYRTNGHARCLAALITTKNGEVSPHLRERSRLRIFYPGAEAADGNLVFGLASDGTGMTADAPRLIDDESELHRKEGAGWSRR